MSDFQRWNTEIYAALAPAVDLLRITFDEQQLDACVAAYASAECDRGLDSGACRFFTGHQSLGQACGATSECAPGLYCTAQQRGMCGACAARAGAQQNCASTLCQEGLQCLTVNTASGPQQMCITFSADVGGQCGTITAGLCRGRLHCVGPSTGPWTCQRPAGPGALCDAQRQSRAGCNLYLNQTCVTGTCQAVQWAAAPGSCNPPSACDATASCNQNTLMCEALPTAGLPCADDRCADGHYCNGAICVLQRAAGATCTADQECADDLYCVSGQCGPYRWAQCP